MISTNIFKFQIEKEVKFKGLKDECHAVVGPVTVSRPWWG